MRTPTITADVVAIIKRALGYGYLQHRIAAYFDINQGRISEVNTGKLGYGIPPADNLPADFPALV